MILVLGVRAFFWASVCVIQDCFGFASPRSVIGLEDSRHILNQWDARLKLIAAWSPWFSRASRSLYVSLVTFSFLLFGQCSYSGLLGLGILSKSAQWVKQKAALWGAIQLNLLRNKVLILTWGLKNYKDGHVPYAEVFLNHCVIEHGH